MDNPQQNIASAVQTADYYDNLWATLGASLDYTELTRARFIVTAIEDFTRAADLRILDLGCGRGWLAPFLSRFGTVTAVDFSETGIQFAREHYGHHAHFILADAQSATLGLPEPTAFDVVVCSEVLEHVPDHGALLRQINGFLSPAGWCVLTTPNGNVWPQFRADGRFTRQLQPVENWVTTARLVELLVQAGFSVARHEGAPVFSFRVGWQGWFQRQRIEKISGRLGLAHWYGRLILPTALYQMAAAQKKV